MLKETAVCPALSSFTREAAHILCEVRDGAKAGFPDTLVSLGNSSYVHDSSVWLGGVAYYLVPLSCESKTGQLSPHLCQWELEHMGQNYTVVAEHT